MNVIGGNVLYGKLSAKDYAHLLKAARESRFSRLEIERQAARRGSKLAELLGEHGLYWWAFYELPLNAHLAVFVILAGWGQQLVEIAKGENPPRDFLRFMRTEDESECSPFEEMRPDRQALFVNVLLGVMYSLESIGYYSLSINELLEKGDEHSLRSAVSVDRTVIASTVGAQLIASAQLRRDKAFLSGLFRRIRNPHSARRQYVDLRVMHRIFDEASALVSCNHEQILGLVESLGLYIGKREDPVKGLSELFRNWKKEATS